MSEQASESRRTFGHYEVESVLGKGAMGMVYLARDRRIGRRVALKTVHVDEQFDDASEASEFYKRLQREAELCGALQHPNIVTLYEPGYEKEVIAWLATEYVDGESLRDRLRKRKPLPLPEALRIAEDILRGLAYAHAKGIVHRDIKPANILLTGAGEAKIADFGIARPPESNLTAVGEMLGTPSYMSPEQVKSAPVSARSDLFSAGAVIYEMIAGVKAFSGPDVSTILRNVVESEPKPAHKVNEDVPESLAEFVERLLAKSPEKRFSSAAAALEELQRIEAEVDTLEEVVEEVSADQAVSTLPPARSSKTAVGTDRTPYVRSGSGTRAPLARRIPTRLFVAIVAILILAFAATALAIRLRTDDSPTATIEPEKLREFSDKRQSLTTARLQYSAGEYQQSLITYDAFLAKYPDHRLAQQERSEVQEALTASKQERKVTVAAKRPKTQPRAQPTKPPEKKSIWRRIFGR